KTTAKRCSRMRSRRGSTREGGTKMKTIVGLTLASLLTAGPAGAAADRPTVVPASGGGGVPIIYGHFDDLDAIGYENAEYFVSGNAHAYGSGSSLTPDGKWDDVAVDADTAAYMT